MAHLKLQKLICEKTQEALDEPLIKVFVDGGLTHDDRWNFGWQKVNDGDRVDIDWERDFDNTVRIELWENDKGKPDFINEFTINCSDDEISPVTRRIEGRNAKYSIMYSLNRTDSVRRFRGLEIEIDSLRCNDAQEYDDEIYVTVNGQVTLFDRFGKTGRVLNPKEGYTHRISNNNDIVIELLELDGNSVFTTGQSLRNTDGRAEVFGRFTITPERAIELSGTPDVIYEVRFQKDKGIVGDADYTLYYKIKQISGV